MISRKIFNINYTVTNYHEATNLIIEKAKCYSSYAVTALAVHGLIESVKDADYLHKVSKIDMILPDGQPIKWVLNHFYKVGLKDRVAGPILTRHVLNKANENGLRIYLYGSTARTLEKLKNFININYLSVTICGMHADRFREAVAEEDIRDIKNINDSKANIVLVGRGCPRQEKWVSSHIGKIDSVMIAVGAAFDYHAQNIRYAPLWMQNAGLEWFFRLLQEPRKLWKRYLITNSYFIYLIICVKIGFKKISFK